MTPRRVYEALVTTDMEAGYPDARRIEGSVQDERFEVVSVGTIPLLTRLQENSTPSDVDVAALACADAHDGVAVMDETYGRDVATAEGITTRGTAYLVLTLAKQGAIGADDARTVTDAMIDEGWYCACCLREGRADTPDTFGVTLLKRHPGMGGSPGMTVSDDYA